MEKWLEVRHEEDGAAALGDGGQERQDWQERPHGGDMIGVREKEETELSLGVPSGAEALLGAGRFQVGPLGEAVGERQGSPVGWGPLLVDWDGLG